MAITLTKLRRMFSVREDESPVKIIETKNLDPEVGFKVSYAATNNEITVRVIGARHLPTTFGVKSVSGYSIKVKLFPGTAKYETQSASQSWPMFNEKFKFKVRPPTSGLKSDDPMSQLNGHFLTFTVYAELGDPEKRTVKDQTKDTYKSFKRTVDTCCTTLAQQAQAGTLKIKPDKKKEREERPMRVSADQRRTVGTVTWSADARTLKETPTNRVYQTQELWRPIKDMGNGAVASRHSITDTRKGQIEIALSYGPPKQLPQPLPSPLTPPPTPATPTGLAPIQFPAASAASGASAASVTSQSTSSAFIRSAMTRLSLRKSLIPQSPEEPKTPITNPFDRIYTSRPANPFDSDSDSDEENDRQDTSGVGKVLTVRTLRVRCSAQVKDRLEAAGGHLYLKTYILDDDRKLRSWRTPKFKPALSNHLDPALSSLSMVIPESDLEYTGISITLFNKNGMNKRVALGSIRIGAGAKNDKCCDHWQSALDAQGEEVTCWQSIE